LAITACLGSPTSAGDSGSPGTTVAGSPELGELRQEVVNLRAALRTKPVIGRALGVVEERYGLRDPQAAFDLLRDSAQRHNLRLYSLARALLAAPAPAGPTWFPGRIRRPAPSLSIFRLNTDQRGNRTAVLGLFADAVAEYLHATMVTVHLVEPSGRRLHLEMSRRLPPTLADNTADEDDPTVPWHRAVTDKALVMVKNIAAEPDFAGREVLLGAGVGALVCAPLLTLEKSCVGVVTTYHADAEFTPTRLQAAKLDHAATEIAAWLEWHAGTVVVDALEAVHHGAAGSDRRAGRFA